MSNKRRDRSKGKGYATGHSSNSSGDSPPDAGPFSNDLFDSFQQGYGSPMRRSQTPSGASFIPAYQGASRPAPEVAISPFAVPSDGRTATTPYKYIESNGPQPPPPPEDRQCRICQARKLLSAFPPQG